MDVYLIVIFVCRTFDLDAFKRSYSNEDTLTKAIPFLWTNFDAEHYSIWFAEYKYPQELTLVFMSCNLINGKDRLTIYRCKLIYL
jgi:hypothetical protein